MSTEHKTSISIHAVINAPVEKVWHHWTSPDSIKAWNQASDDWHTTRAENDLRKGGRFMSRMEAKDGSFGFDFEGIYDEVKTHEIIAYSLGDERKVKIVFTTLAIKPGLMKLLMPKTQTRLNFRKMAGRQFSTISRNL